MGMLYEYWDDVAVPVAADAVELSAATRAAVIEQATAWLPALVRGGEYRNRFGERVTWRSSGDGRYVVVQTWPEPVGSTKRHGDDTGAGE